MPVVKVFKTHRSFGVIIPIQICYDQHIGVGTMFELTSDEWGRLILQRLQIATAAPKGSIWTVVKQNDDDGE